MSILTGLVIVVAMATLAQKSDRLLDIFFGEEVAGIAPQNDSVTVVAGRPEIIDVLANDENVSPEDVGGVRILVSPSCGAAETADNGVLYISNERCVGEQLFAYCVQRGDECTSASVNVNVVSSEPQKPVVGAQQQVATNNAPQAIEPVEVPRADAGAATVPAPAIDTASASDAPVIRAAPEPSSANEPTVAATAPTTDGGVAAVVRTFTPTTPEIAQLGRSPTFGADDGNADALRGLSNDSEPAIRLGAVPALAQPRAGEAATGATDVQRGSRVARLSLENDVTIAPRADAPDLSDIAPPAPPQEATVEVARVEPADAATDTTEQIQSDVVASIGSSPTPSPSPRPRPAALTPSDAPVARGCGQAEMVSRRGPGANSVIRIVSSCRAGEVVTLSHAGLEFAGRLDNAGRLTMELPVMDIDSGVVAVFGDGGRAVAPLDYDDRAVDLALRVAVSWTTPVDLDLHVFEYAAGFGADGHVWQENPRAFRDVRRAGGGYLLSFPSLKAGGQSIEVYTFWANSRARPGFARIALDHASRGDTPAGEFCGNGLLAAPDYQVVRASGGSVTSRAKGRFAPAACGVALAADARYANGAVKDLEIAGR
ncbi:MAG: hypothetical protein ACPGFA_09375 [Pikeienuella sp.]